jgi:two-component system CheB/CheR fusion protein
MARTSASFLAASEYRLLVEHAPTMIWRSGIDSRCDYFNETWLKFTGRSMDQELGDGWAEGVHPEDLDTCVKYYQDHFRRREPFEMQYRLRRHDGVYRTVSDWGVPYSDERGRFAGFIGSCVDVKDQAQTARARTTFLALVAHELRTPLASMRGFIEAIRRQADQGRLAEGRLLSRLAAQVDRLALLVRDFVDMARAEEGRELPLVLRDVDLADLLKSAVSVVEETAAIREDRSHPIEERVDSGPIVARCDRARVEQIVLDLLDNAVKYSPAGSPIRVELRSRGTEWTISVADAGIGVPPGELTRLTEPYFRASNAPAESFPGVGIGLSIVRGLVERHGGRLRVESELGSGTTVTVSLPSPAMMTRSP